MLFTPIVLANGYWTIFYLWPDQNQNQIAERYWNAILCSSVYLWIVEVDHRIILIQCHCCHLAWFTLHHLTRSLFHISICDSVTMRLCSLSLFLRSPLTFWPLSPLSQRALNLWRLLSQFQCRPNSQRIPGATTRERTAAAPHRELRQWILCCEFSTFVRRTHS